MRTSPPINRFAAFTLVEMLVVIAIVAVLAVMATSAVRSAMGSASRAKSAANLRNFGIAMFGFSSDNDGTLPGASGGKAGTLSGISPFAKSSAANSLQVQLMSYLEKDRPSGNSWGVFFMKSLSYPAWQAFNKGVADNGIPSYIACQSYPLPDGTSLSPFGGPGASQAPLKLAVLQDKLAQFRPEDSKPYAVIEPDQNLYDFVTWNAPSWKQKLSTNALHGSYRNVLQFDGSVNAVPVTKRPYPW